MKQHYIGLGTLVLAACSSTVSTAITPSADVPVPAIVDAGIAVDRQPVVDAPVVDDVREFLLDVHVDPSTPPSRTVARNATGIPVMNFAIEAGYRAVGISMLHFRRVGVGAVADVANVYLYMTDPPTHAFASPVRYSLGRAVNARTNEITVPFEVGLTPHARVGLSLTIDLASATPGSQHAFELISIDLIDSGVVTTIPLENVRGNPITISPELATRIDVRNNAPLGAIRSGDPDAVVASFVLVNGVHDADVHQISLVQTGSVITNEAIGPITLWLGEHQIPLLPSEDPFGSYLVLVPQNPIALEAGEEATFAVRSSVTAPAGRTLRIFLEYPTDVSATDRVLGSPAGLCISSEMVGACNASGQGSYDGANDTSMSETSTISP